MVSVIRTPVPTGTVLFVTITLYSVMALPMSAATDNTADKSALPSWEKAVPTAMKSTS